MPRKNSRKPMSKGWEITSPAAERQRALNKIRVKKGVVPPPGLNKQYEQENYVEVIEKGRKKRKQPKYTVTTNVPAGAPYITLTSLAKGLPGKWKFPKNITIPRSQYKKIVKLLYKLSMLVTLYWDE